MYAPTFRLRAFETIGDAAKVSVLFHLLEALISVNVALLLEQPDTPWLYESGVVYRREARGLEDWLDIAEVLERGFADCEDLGCWRIAELRVREDEHAVPFLRRFADQQCRGSSM